MHELAVCLQGTESRLRAWRHSAARAGSDEALSWVLSWYQKIDLDALLTQREGSGWVTDQPLIQQRQARACEIARWPNSRTFIDGPADSDNEDGEEETEDEAEDEVEEAGDGDEEMESDADIRRAATDTTNADVSNVDAAAANTDAADIAATEAAA